MQQHEHALVRPQNREQTNLIFQRSADHLHPHTRRKPMRLRQFNQTVFLATFDLGDNRIGNVRRLLTVHDQAPYTCGPARIPPARNNQHESIAGKQQRRALDLATTTADLLAQPRTINFEAVEAKTMQRETFAVWLDFSATPKKCAPPRAG